MLGVVKTEEPDNSGAPPEAAAYQSTVAPPAGEAPIVTVPVPHLDALSAPGAAGTAFTVATTAVLVAEKQPVVVFRACA